MNAVAQINVRAAFGQPNEADLVDALRRSQELALSVVAIHGGNIVGHLAFSPVTIESLNSVFPALDSLAGARRIFLASSCP